MQKVVEKRMPKIQIISKNITIEATENENLLQVLHQHQLGVVAHCGGLGRCGTCKVKVNGEEQLACQTTVQEDITLELLEKDIPNLQIMVDGMERDIVFEPKIIKRFLSNGLNIPNTSFTSLKEHINEILKYLGIKENPRIPYTILKELALLKVLEDITFVILDDPISRQQELIKIELGDTRAFSYGLAVDIGSTTVAMYLHDLVTGKLIGISSRMNTQATYGADVLSRISFIQQNDHGLAILHKTITQLINEMIEELTSKYQISKEHIYEGIFVGNTTMQHILLGISPISLGHSPYIPVIKESHRVAAREIELHIPYAEIYTLPNLGGFVGSDTSAVILATKMHEEQENNLAVDIGTNGEMVLRTPSKLIACSSPAGPAFEGAQITFGMPAKKGAISKVWLEFDLQMEVIGDAKPIGICGSGLVDIVAELLRVGIIDQTGRLKSKKELSPMVSFLLKNRIVENEEGNLFLLVDELKSGNGKPIYLTQKDIRELQLAKAAIFTGIQLLLLREEITIDQVSHLYLAGGFGNYIDKYNAMRIGLIPRLKEEQLVPVGNAAGYGARLALLSKVEMEQLQNKLRNVEHFHLAEDPQYETIFIKALEFPMGERW